MNSPIFSFQRLQLFVTVLSSSIAAAHFNIPRLSPTLGTILEQPEILSASVSKDLQTFYYPQTLDHFNYRPESYSAFQQRYVMNFKHWGGANASAPILAYLGAEAPLDDDLTVIGFLNENAIHFKALLVYIEHRYYGKSIPFGSREEAFKNASTRGYFNSAQAITDYAEIIMHIKKKLHAFYSPVIVIGGSYGGMLASWFRLKYPHVALGALASSAPILYFDDIKLQPEGGYYSVVTKDFREASETCYQTIQKSWSEIDKVASEPQGLSTLSKKFKTCYPLTSSSELKSFLVLMYAYAAQYDRPPRYPVTAVCGGIDGASSIGSEVDTLSKIFAGVVAYYKNRSCYVNPTANASETDIGWRWQRCSEMVIPISIGNGTMFEPSPFDLKRFMNRCESFYGVPPRPHWITSYYGGHTQFCRI
ncbi:lysosomal Pro-X carboxypeptidase-like isoform X2 [Durio zibethinus]|uniref:Lysosomal Pro-X carboxypeptidase-like isoform X2 n=1 Tax=Durio zibethinus TaxID=66656 RepID=A0A6P5ZW39_DURZI|nr:lysosomal Pro-X carboxypeptidase-like isoform X2 [Durio zibethinus]